MTTGAILFGALVVAGIPFAICFGLCLGGRLRAAWWTAGGIAALTVGATAILWTRDYPAGLAGFAILILTATVMLPILIGTLLGAGAGHLLVLRRRAARRGLPRRGPRR